MYSVSYFFAQLLEPSSRVTADVYAFMFMCDFFNFMVVIFGFASFGVSPYIFILKYLYHITLFS